MKVPKELLDEWETEWVSDVEPRFNSKWDAYEFFANKGAEWAYKKGADDELDACEEWLSIQLNCTDQEHLVPYLRNARRSQTLNDIALKMLETIEKDGRYLPEITDTIRKALKEKNEN